MDAECNFPEWTIALSEQLNKTHKIDITTATSLICGVNPFDPNALITNAVQGEFYRSVIDKIRDAISQGYIEVEEYGKGLPPILRLSSFKIWAISQGYPWPLPGSNSITIADYETREFLQFHIKKLTARKNEIIIEYDDLKSKHRKLEEGFDQLDQYLATAEAERNQAIIELNEYKNTDAHGDSLRLRQQLDALAKEKDKLSLDLKQKADEHNHLWRDWRDRMNELIDTQSERDRLRDELEQLRQQHPQPSTQPAAESDAGDMATKSYNTHARAWAALALTQGVKIYGSYMEGLASFHASIPEAGRPSLNWLKDVINDGRKMIPAPPLDAK